MPNLYSASLKQEDKLSEVLFSILPNPLYNITKEEYLETHKFKVITEANLTDMHNRVNKLKKIQSQLIEIIKELPEEQKYMSFKI